MKKSPRIPLVIVSCVAFALAGCNQKSAATDPAKERQMQDMQAKIDALSAQSAELNKQLADRQTAEVEEKRTELEKQQTDLENQRAQLEADRKAVAAVTPERQPVNETVNTAYDGSTDDDAEPVYQGKPATYDIFYTKLQDDGDWIESDEYGYIWRPSVATRNRQWRPYSDGRWVETERGWTWDSNERFGWATYHYGRWVNLNNSGWCWIPGDEWAPAWVSWRSNDRYVGWAPLPPEARISRGGSITASIDVGYDTGPGSYNFVDTEDFGEETYVGRLAAPEQNITIINQTVNVTNITYNDRSIHNYGPDYDSISRRSRRPINRYQLALERSSQFDRDSTVPRPRGDRLAIVAPLLVADGRGNSDVRPVKVEKKIVKADRDNGWRGVKPEQRQAVKVDLEKQADRQVQNQQAQREQQRLLKARQEARAVRDKANAQAQPAQHPPNTPAAEAPPSSPIPARSVANRPEATPSRTPRPTNGEQPRAPRDPQARPGDKTTPIADTKPRSPKPVPTPVIARTPAEPPLVTAPTEPVKVQTPASAADTNQAQSVELLRQQRQAAQQAERQKAAQATREQAARQREEAVKADQARSQAIQAEQRRQQIAAQADQLEQAQRQARRQQVEAQREQAARQAPQAPPRQPQEDQPRREPQRQDPPEEKKRPKATPTDDTPEDGNPRAKRPR